MSRTRSGTSSSSRPPSRPALSRFGGTAGGRSHRAECPAYLPPSVPSSKSAVSAMENIWDTQILDRMLSHLIQVPGLDRRVNADSAGSLAVSRIVTAPIWTSNRGVPFAWRRAVFPILYENAGADRSYEKFEDGVGARRRVD